MTTTVTVNILGKDFQVACSEEERDDLLRAAHQLDHRMRKIRNAGTVIGMERIAVMAALNLSHDLLQAHQEQSQMDDQMLKRMSDKIDDALSRLE
ncbi:cell division protein ZapA [Marinibactrum halimedae]|uniref:Cell division protein ZapA n=1 Tax=Marinibactrum halimedae TaxID=1444977 RepID=A0AA37T238_9GAMM|nr:cell division protein ZapA [Marinibactrum halimedae]MCD9457719.1 cell division protein ZapA [Marinibactrum halimedae]GLS24908.1 cell division protein ZapA [Marinibactrum halimedae]